MTRRRLVPYLLLGPGLLWLVLFFVVPMYFMGVVSLEEGSLEEGFTVHLALRQLHRLARRPSTRSFGARSSTPAPRRCSALLIAYPLAYAIAFRGGRWKNALAIRVVAPFFTTYLIRTLAWQTILADESQVVDVLQTLGIVGGRPGADTAPAVIAGLTYNFLPFMILPIYASLERIDLSLIEGAKDLYSSAASAFLRVTLPISAPGVIAGTLLTFIPAVGDYVNALLPRQPEPGDDRQRDPERVPGDQGLSGRRGALVRADGDHPGDRSSSTSASRARSR